MLVFLNQALVVLATPKTGSTALEKALRPKAGIIFSGKPSVKHMRYQTYLRLLDSYLENQMDARPTTCAAMRHPVEWLFSWYRYRRRDLLDGNANSTKHVSFEEFVTAYLQPVRPPFASVGSQFRFLAINDGTRKVDRVFRYESGALVRFLERQLNVSIKTGRENVSPAGDMALSAATLSKLEKAQEDDFALYEKAET